MRKLVSLSAVLLGVVGVVLCIAAIGFGWRTAVKTIDRIDRIAMRVDSGLSETDERLARVESRVSTIRTELKEVRGGAEALIAQNPELPRVQAEIKQLLDRLGPALDQLNATADSLGTVAAGLRAVADIVDQINNDPEATARVRNAADMINRAGEALSLPQAKIDAVKSAKAVQMTQKLVTLAREAVADSEMLAEGIAAAREQIAVARKQTPEYRDAVVFRVYALAVANTLFWLWFGLGQVCLFHWGRRRISNRVPVIS